MNDLNVGQVYICHYKKLTQRKIDLVDHLNQFKIFSYNWVELYDIDDWDLNEIKNNYPSIIGSRPRGNNILLPLSASSLALKHCWIIKDIIKNNYKSALIFEDDVRLVDNFVSLFNSYIMQLPSDWDLCWVGSCCNLHSHIVPNKNVYKESSSRCTHAYLISNQCAKKILEYLPEIDDAIDWYYNTLIEKLNLNNYWFEPDLAYQNHNYGSTIVVE